MTWFYSQSKGYVWHGDLLVATGCYSGFGDGKNSPDHQNVEDVGPIPEGGYTISDEMECTNSEGACPHCHEADGRHKHGPNVLRLIPDAANEMYGRSGFLWHGDSVKAPGTASRGCICSAPVVRIDKVYQSGDRRLEVVRDVIQPEAVTA